MGLYANSCIEGKREFCKRREVMLACFYFVGGAANRKITFPSMLLQTNRYPDTIISISTWMKKWYLAHVGTEVGSYLLGG